MQISVEAKSPSKFGIEGLIFRLKVYNDVGEKPSFTFQTYTHAPSSIPREPAPICFSFNHTLLDGNKKIKQKINFTHFISCLSRFLVNKFTTPCICFHIQCEFLQNQNTWLSSIIYNEWNVSCFCEAGYEWDSRLVILSDTHLCELSPSVRTFIDT